MKRITGALALLCAAAVSAVHGQTVRIQTYPSSISSLQAVVAVERGFCTKQGISCELKNLNSGTLGIQTLVGKSIEVAMPEINAAIASAAGGADIQLLSGSVSRPIFTLVARSDLNLPNRGKGYPAAMRDLKGMKIGVTARGAGSEMQLLQLLKGAGMSPSDVTIVPVGTPGTAYASLVVGKQVDALLMYEPVRTLCRHTGNCVVVVDPAAGEGPPEVLAQDGAAVPLVARREWIEANPQVVSALLAALAEAEQWAGNPANFDELVKIYTPIIPLKLENADAIRRGWLKNAVQAYDLRLKRPAVQAAMRKVLDDGLIARPLDLDRFISRHAPQ